MSLQDFMSLPFPLRSTTSMESSERPARNTESLRALIVGYFFLVSADGSPVAP